MGVTGGREGIGEKTQESVGGIRGWCASHLKRRGGGRAFQRKVMAFFFCFPKTILGLPRPSLGAEEVK